MTDDDAEDYEREWEDLSEKVILAQILTELTRIRMALENADTGGSSDSNDSVVYECDMCGATMQGDECARHAESEHRAPPGEWESMFTEEGK